MLYEKAKQLDFTGIQKEKEKNDYNYVINIKISRFIFYIMQEVDQKALGSQQELLNDFQSQCLDLLYNDSETQQALNVLVSKIQPINGFIKVTKMTKGYFKYLKSHRIKVEKDKHLWMYIPLEEFKKAEKNWQSSQTLKDIITKYEKMTPVEKEKNYLFIFEIPYSHNFSQSLQNCLMIDKSWI